MILTGQPIRPKPLPYLTRQRPLYENCSVYAVDGHTLLFRCSRKKLEWYLARDLARRIDPPPIINQSDGGQAIALTFTSRGLGRTHQPWYLEPKRNECVVCGGHDMKGLVMLSVVPHQYRRHLPVCIKSHSHIDILPTCVPCHAHYTAQTHHVTRMLANHYQIPESGTPWIQRPEWTAARKAAGALLSKNVTHIPIERKMYLRERVARGLGITDATSLTKDQLQMAISLPDAQRGPNFIEHGQGVVQAILAERDMMVLQRTGKPDTLELGTGCKVASHKDTITSSDDVIDIDGRNETLPRDEDPVVTFVVMWRRHFIQVAQPENLSAHYDIHANVYNI